MTTTDFDESIYSEEDDNRSFIAVVLIMDSHSAAVVASMIKLVRLVSSLYPAYNLIHGVPTGGGWLLLIQTWGIFDIVCVNIP